MIRPTRIAVRHVLFGSESTISGEIYGTIVVMATIVAGGANDGVGPWELAVAAVVTNVVLALAHLYAEVIAGGIERHRALTGPERNEIVRREMAIPLAAAWPVIGLFLGSLGVLAEDDAIWIALAVGTVSLAVQGARHARVQDLGGWGTALSVTLNAALGLALVGLKVLISH